MRAMTQELIEGYQELAQAQKSKEVVFPPKTRQLAKKRLYFAGKHVNIMQKGWEPWEVPKGLVLGTIEVYPAWQDWLGWLVPLALAGGMFWLAFVVDFRWLWLIPAVLVALLGAGIWQDTGDTRSYNFYRKHAPRALSDLGMDSAGTAKYQVCRYMEAIPLSVHKRYQDTRHMFDEVYIGSFERAYFELETRLSRVGGCPFLIGIRDGYTYLGGQWDITRELAYMEPA